MECCGLVEGPHEWCLTLSTTSRVPKPVYEALLGPCTQIWCSKKEVSGNSGTRNVDRNEPHGHQVRVLVSPVGEDLGRLS